jgi:hypothetical protein
MAQVIKARILERMEADLTILVELCEIACRNPGLNRRIAFGSCSSYLI